MTGDQNKITSSYTPNELTVISNLPIKKIKADLNIKQMAYKARDELRPEKWAA